jgi:adenosylcobinamide kinase/adenosylcobinamide-phosphate guanylyltransferase
MSGVTLVLGGARSGKSRYAETLGANARRRVYIATAEIIDEEMRDRVAEHRARRGRDWLTKEVPLDLTSALGDADAKDAFILVDCITIWLGNLIHYRRDPKEEVDRLCETLKHARGRIAIVANEVGLGIVPDNELARRFRDEAGRANQRIAEIAGEVIFMAAGLPLVLKRGARSRPHKRRAGSVRARKG